MSIDNLKTVIYGTTLVLVSIGLLYLVSKYYFNRLLAGLEPCEISVLNLGNHNEAIYVVDLGVHFNTRVFLSRTHQTKSYWLPFFAFVTEWDPEKMGVNLVSQVLRKKNKGQKTDFDLRYERTFEVLYPKRAGIVAGVLFSSTPEGGKGGVVLI